MSEHDLEELQESAEHGHEHRQMAPVSLTMALLAVLVAISGVLGHRSHTEETVLQNRATDQWGFYQAKHQRRTMDEHGMDDRKLTLAASPSATVKELASSQVEKYKAEVEHYKEEEKEIQEKARELEAEVDLAGRRADRYDFGEALLEIALVITSITLLTERRAFWYSGIVIGLLGLLAAASALLVH